MEPCTIRHVSVWLDELSPRAGAFAQALEWAARLGVALQGIIPPARKDPPTIARVNACAAACAERGTPWEGAAEAGTERLLRPLGLCAFGTTLPTHWRETWLHQSRRHDPAALLLCTDACRPIQRPLVLVQRDDAVGGYLPFVAHLCHALRVTPVVLLLSATEAEAADRQGQAERAFADYRLRADFDHVVSSDPCTAVGCVARWRDCTQVIVEREPSMPSWRRWFRGELVDQLQRLSGSHTILALPNLPAPARPVRDRGPAAAPDGAPLETLLGQTDSRHEVTL